MVLRNKTRRLRKIPGNVKAPVEASDRSLGGIFKVALTRPWRLLIDPISFFVTIYYAVVYTLLYMLFSIYPIVFKQKRGWNAGVGELPLVGTVISACLGGLALFSISQVNQKRAAQNHKPVPEDRLPSVMFAVTIIWFAWTAQYNSVHWAVPTVAGTFLARSILLIFVIFINYIIDSYLMYAASAVAASPLFTQYIFDSLGVGGAGSLIGGIGLLLMPIPFFAPMDESPHPPADEEKAVNDGLPMQISNKEQLVDENSGGAGE
ncbi:MFS general substrate transporter [Penicillium alfredii]|uniref:MFS general substrate transporter n=1 Tax=Penicillium alfredii TaxID=1506179 RepID=A0A9W9FSM0_9EURO|nr:MFS general substrate transporter [Penicillium alfredii]KAJ5105669.1 MFS general substrate transporter [Penicillium alfredii]